MEILLREEGRYCFTLASHKSKKDQKDLRSKLVEYFPKQDSHMNKPSTEKQFTNKMN